MELKELISKLELLAPNKAAEKWDNPGLLVDTKRDIKKVMLAVDASDYVIEKAIDNNVDLIITHHPLIFTGLKKVNYADFIGRRILSLAANGIALYAMHTNYDICQLSDAAGKKLGLVKEGIIEITDESENVGFGMYGTISDDELSKIGKRECNITVNDIANLVKLQFELPNVRVFGDLNKNVSRIGIFPGSGKSAVHEAISNSIDVLVTGDIDHHAGIDAVAEGMCIIDAGHYGIEKIFVDCMEEYFSKEMPQMEIVAIKDDEPFVTV